MTDHRPLDHGDTLPPVPRARRPTAEARLLEAAIAAIESGGEHNVKVQHIADAAGVQIPILYRKFGSRDGLIQAAHLARLSSQLEREVVELGAVLAGAGTAEEFAALLEVVLLALCSSERRSARMQRIHIIGSTHGRPALAEAVSKVQQRAIAGIASMFRGPQERGWLRPALDLEAFAAWVGGMTLGRVVIELGDDAEFPAWDAIYIDAVRHVLLAPPDSQT